MMRHNIFKTILLRVFIVDTYTAFVWKLLNTILWTVGYLYSLLMLYKVFKLTTC